MCMVDVVLSLVHPVADRTAAVQSVHHDLLSSQGPPLLSPTLSAEQLARPCPPADASPGRRAARRAFRGTFHASSRSA